MKLTIENPNTNNIDELFYASINEHNKKHVYYFFICEFKLILNDNQHSGYIKSCSFDDKTIVSWWIFLDKVIRDFKDKGNNFNNLEEMNFITIANKLDISYDFYIKHNMHAVEWKLSAMVNKNKNLFNKLDRSKRHL